MWLNRALCASIPGLLRYERGQRAAVRRTRRRDALCTHRRRPPIKVQVVLVRVMRCDSLESRTACYRRPSTRPARGHFKTERSARISLRPSRQLNHQSTDQLRGPPSALSIPAMPCEPIRSLAGARACSTGRCRSGQEIGPEEEAQGSKKSDGSAEEADFDPWQCDKG